MKIFVTGAEGFTGRYLCSELKTRGAVPVPYKGDILERTALSKDLSANKPDVIIHLAAISYAVSDDQSSYYQVNVVGTSNLLELAAQFCPEAKIILVSSATIYNTHGAELISEDRDIAPQNHYGASKAAMELCAEIWRREANIIIVRPFNYTGVGQEEHFLVPKIVRHFRDKLPLIELGNLAIARDIGDVRSVCSAYCDLALSEIRNGVFNVSSGKAYSILEILEMAQLVTGHRPEIRVNEEFVRPFDPPHLAGDNGRLRAILPDWKPIQFAETLSWMLTAGKQAI